MPVARVRVRAGGRPRHQLTARLTKDWDGDVRAFDAVYDHILHMADALSDGIVKQFPDKFGNAAVSTTGR